jgi:hypothetical protein
MHLQSDAAYRFAAVLALAAASMIVWFNVAAGLIGIEDDDPANLVYAGVLAIGSIGAILARFQPRGLARAMFVTAMAQALVGALALKYPNTANPVQIVLLHLLFVAMFAGAGLLFAHAARERSARPAGAH